MTAKVTKRLARQIATGLAKRRSRWTEDEVRDYCDLATYSDLDFTQLNLLTDWVVEALRS